MINIAPLTEFINLKELELHLNYEHAFADFVSFHGCIKFTNVTALEIYGPYGSTVTLTHADKFFRKFPNLESLFVDEWVLTNEDFLAICQFMPKLKYLFIESSEISVETLFDLHNFSLKDLKSLESLSIKTKFENLYFFQPSWPSLPNLKSVNLQGEGFRCLTQCFFTQIVERSPRIENLEIFYAYDSEEYNHSKFLPILSRLNLKDLILPGEGGSATSTQNTKLVDSVIKHCKNLTFFGIHDVNGFSLAQEIQLFKNLPKLKIINSDSMDDNRYYCRYMERKDFVDLKEYLAKYLYKYKDMTGTIAYLYNHQIPLPERIQIEKDFDTKYDEDDLKIWYTVLRGYLNMNDLDFCRTLKFHVH
ncbi:uncharacterized protein LOC134831580 [Culicoides brevitarsis]|uniref:uncharacterized protein LOC134831580 n=1 Tax=Culicoides brevitarsis TaxID=469753 RepID=UPI00307BAE4B